MKMLKKYIYVTIITLLLFPFNFLIAKGQINYSITLNVETSSGAEVQGIRIDLDGPGSYGSSKTTDSDGKIVFHDMEDPGVYTATILFNSSSTWKLADSESSKDKEVTLSATSPSKTIKFLVEKKATTTEAPREEEPQILKTQLPAVFRKVGSTTTDLSKLDPAKLDRVEKFTLDDPSTNKIVFLEPIDLSDDETAEKFQDLDDYVFISDPGRVSIDSEELPELDKKAQITMRGINLVSGSTPKILEDGKNSSKISKIKYDGKDITFEVTGFSAYMYVPTLEIYNTEETTDKSDFLLKGHVDDLDAKVDIYLDEEQVGEAIEPDRNGEFEFRYELKEKENDFQIVAFSESGQTDNASYSIEYTGGEEETEANQPKQVPFILILAIVLGVAIIVWLTIYFIRRAKKKSANPLIERELKELETENPPLPEEEKEDLIDNKIGQTDLTEISKDKE